MQAVCLIFKKLCQRDNVVIYSVEDCLRKEIFNVEIDILRRAVNFYDSENLNLGSVSLDSQSVNLVNHIHKHVVLIICAKILGIINKQNFPETMNIICH